MSEKSQEVVPSTPVTYPPTPDLEYTISRIRYYPPDESGVEQIQNIDITRKGYGHVFNGTVEEAKAEGFVFGEPDPVEVEDAVPPMQFDVTITHVSGEPVKVSGIKYNRRTNEVEAIKIASLGTGDRLFTGTIDEARAAGFTLDVIPIVEEGPEVAEFPLTDMAERISILEGDAKQSQGIIDNLQHELSRANERVAALSRRAVEVAEHRDETLRQWAVEKVAKGNLTRAVANEMLDLFGIENVPGKFSGDAVFLDGSRIEAIVFEADDEDDWESKVRDALEIGTVRVKYEVTIQDADTTRSVKVDDDNSDYSPDESDSWVSFENVEEVE